jgi:cytosine/adenosine deaminase-related metal-dependent hydrolase
LGDVALLPGLVNAHTHLEFSDLTSPLGEPGEPFPRWLVRVVEDRRRADRRPVDAVRAGLQECLQTGSTTIGEIATGDTWARLLAAGAPSPDVTLFHETIGLARSVRTERKIRAEAHLASQSPDNVQRGLSPHAPYTVGMELLEGLIALAARRGVPLAMHLAESREELELLRSSSGPLVELLASLGAWDASAIPQGTRPLDYLRRLARAPRALVIHGNYLAEVEQEFLAAHADRMAVVYCPRTHAYFRHEPYPLADLLRRRVNVLLGTDGRASNPDLNLLEEARLVASKHTAVSPAEALSLITLGAAKALGLVKHVGSLAPGNLANLAAIPIDSSATRDPCELVIASTAAPQAVWWRGSRVF